MFDLKKKIEVKQICEAFFIGNIPTHASVMDISSIMTAVVQHIRVELVVFWTNKHDEDGIYNFEEASR